jgi:hypothetical protein
MFVAAVANFAVPLPPVPTGPTTWPHIGDVLAWCQAVGPGVAAVLIIVGIVYALYGWEIYRTLMAANAAVIGAYLGATLGKAGGDTAVLGTIVGAVLAASIAWPLSKWVVAATGAVVGITMGAALWRMGGLDPRLIWAGSLIGLCTFGFLTFVVLKHAVMLYTGFEGAMLFVAGLVGLLFHFPAMPKLVVNVLTSRPAILTAVILLAGVMSYVYQHSAAVAPAGGGAKPPAKK